jgi:hypothetical protein
MRRMILILMILFICICNISANTLSLFYIDTKTDTYNYYYFNSNEDTYENSLEKINPEESKYLIISGPINPTVNKNEYLIIGPVKYSKSKIIINDNAKLNKLDLLKSNLSFGTISKIKITSNNNEYLAIYKQYEEPVYDRKIDYQILHEKDNYLIPVLNITLSRGGDGGEQWDSYWKLVNTDEDNDLEIEIIKIMGYAFEKDFDFQRIIYDWNGKKFISKEFKNKIQNYKFGF